MASKKALKYLDGKFIICYISFLDIVIKEVSNLKDIAEVAPIIKTSLMSKQLNISTFLSQLIASACSKFPFQIFYLGSFDNA